jgi:hypothetical protein
MSASLDAGFFKDRLSVSITYFRNRSSNQLGFQGVSSIAGSAGLRANLPATVENTGFEIAAHSTIIQRSNFTWSSSFNITLPRNRLVKLTGTTADLQDEFINKPLGIFKVFHYLGVDSQSGLYTFADKDGKATSTPDGSLDKTVYIDLNPKYYGGFQNTIKYRNLSIDFLVQIVKQIAQNSQHGMLPATTAINQPLSILDRWQQPGDEASIQKYSSGFALFSQFSAATQSDKAFSDASYLRLKNLSVSYEFPGNWLKLTKLQSGRLFFNGQNLVTITDFVGLDPETRTTSGMPPLKVFSFGINLVL